MKSIEVAILNPEAISRAEQMMVCAARLTQRGEKVKNLKDFFELYKRPYADVTVENMAALPHPTIQKFGVINVVVVGASRRFLAQVTRHQNEVKFMSASLQYSDYSGEADFVIPYAMEDTLQQKAYTDACKRAMHTYENLIEYDIDNDAAGYVAPQGLRNVLIISATPYQWKHMIGQRICRRNTQETRFVFLKIWELLFAENPRLFSCKTTGPFCMRGACREGKMACGVPIPCTMSPHEILEKDFPKYYKKEKEI